MVALALAAGAVAAIVSWVVVASRAVDVSYFATAAQVLPVFLVAFAIEQRLVERVGASEEEYVQAATDLAGDAVRARQAWENLDEREARRLGARVDAHSDYGWLWSVADDVLYGDPDDPPDVETLAREHYKGRRRSQGILVLAALTVVVVGEATAVGGLLANGATGRSVWLIGSVGALAASVLLITISPLPDLLRSVRGETE